MTDETLPTSLRPNTPLELTPLRVEQARADFDSWIRLDRFPDLNGGAAQRQAVGRHAIIALIH